VGTAALGYPSHLVSICIIPRIRTIRKMT